MNKLRWLDPKMYDCPFPILLTMAFCASVADLATDDPHLRCLHAPHLSLWFSNSAYIYLSVSFI
jgi:hypothetical protein